MATELRASRNIEPRDNRWVLVEDLEIYPGNAVMITFNGYARTAYPQAQNKGCVGVAVAYAADLVPTGTERVEVMEGEFAFPSIYLAQANVGDVVYWSLNSVPRPYATAVATSPRLGVVTEIDATNGIAWVLIKKEVSLGDPK